MRALDVIRFVVAGSFALGLIVGPGSFSRPDAVMTTAIPAPVPLLAGPQVQVANRVVQDLRTEPSQAVDVSRFSVEYRGFTPEAEEAFQRAVDIWSARLKTTVPITVEATFAPLGDSVLGQAAPSRLVADFPGAVQPHTFYPAALANKEAGERVSGGPDIIASFSSNFSGWYFGTGMVPTGKCDFETAVLHELAHGLGFVGAASVQNSVGAIGTPGAPLVFDQYTRVADGALLTQFPPNSSDLATALQSGRVAFDSTLVRAVNGGQPAALYAPSPWNDSSYNHLDEKTFPAGTPNALMTPVLDRGESDHDPGAIAIAVLNTLGW